MDQPLSFPFILDTLLQLFSVQPHITLPWPVFIKLSHSFSSLHRTWRRLQICHLGFFTSQSYVNYVKPSEGLEVWSPMLPDGRAIDHCCSSAYLTSLSSPFHTLPLPCFEILLPLGVHRWFSVSCFADSSFIVIFFSWVFQVCSTSRFNFRLFHFCTWYPFPGWILILPWFHCWKLCPKSMPLLGTPDPHIQLSSWYLFSDVLKTLKLCMSWLSYVRFAHTRNNTFWGTWVA